MLKRIKKVKDFWRSVKLARRLGIPLSEAREVHIIEPRRMEPVDLWGIPELRNFDPSEPECWDEDYAGFLRTLEALPTIEEVIDNLDATPRHWEKEVSQETDEAMDVPTKHLDNRNNIHNLIQPGLKLTPVGRKRPWWEVATELLISTALSAVVLAYLVYASGVLALSVQPMSWQDAALFIGLSAAAAGTVVAWVVVCQSSLEKR